MSELSQYGLETLRRRAVYCQTHHHGCDCREYRLQQAEADARRLVRERNNARSERDKARQEAAKLRDAFAPASEPEDKPVPTRRPSPDGPAPADRPELSEALEAIEKAEKAIDDLCQGRARWTMSIPANPDSDPDLVISDALEKAKQAISQPAPAVPEWLRPTGNDQTLGWSWSVRGLQHIANLVTDAAGGEPEPSLEAVDAILTILHQERALAAQPSESPAVPPWVAKRVIAARDAILESDESEAWHQLYGIADPTYTVQKDPWSELERIAAAPTPADGE